MTTVVAMVLVLFDLKAGFGAEDGRS